MNQSQRSAVLGLLAVLLAGGCVVWPEGTGPRAQPMPLAEALARQDKGEVVLLDVRAREDFAQGHIPGAVNIPGSQVQARLAEVRRLGRLPVVYCACPNEFTSLEAARALHSAGVDARVLAGGYGAFLRSGGRAVPDETRRLP